MAGRKQVGAGGKLVRSQVVTVRLDPRIRYGVELAARKHRRTASSFIEWAIEQALEMVVIREAENQRQQPVTAQDAQNQVWDVDEPDRFAELAINFPELLNHEEQVLWKLIRECGFLWRGNWRRQGDREFWSWTVSEQSLDFEKLREHWIMFNEIANGDMPASKLPTWPKERPLENDNPL